MIIIELIIFVVAVAILFFIASQVIVPAVKGTPLFPYFKRTELSKAIDSAEDALEHVAEAEHLKEITKQVVQRTTQLKDQE